MSGFLAGKVWQSDLDAELKPLAAALADIGNDDGTSIYPSVEYMAWLLSRSESTVQRGLKDLRAAGVLKVVREGGRGAGNTTEYKLIAERFPPRPNWRDQRGSQKGVILTPLPVPGPNKGVIHDQEGCHPRSIRVSPVTPNPSLYVSDPYDPGPPTHAFGTPPQGGYGATPAKNRPAVAHQTPVKPTAEGDPQELPARGREWTVIGMNRQGIGCELFQKEWRHYFVEYGNNGQPIAGMLRDFLEHCARLRLAIPPAFERMAREQHGNESHARGN